MAEQLVIVAHAVTAVVLVVGLGAVLRRTKLLTAHADETLLKVIINALFPALILHTIVGNERMTQPANLLIPPLVGFGTVLAGVLLTLQIGKWLGPKAGIHSPAALRTFALSVGLYNYGYIPLPLVEKLFDVGSAQPATLGVLFVHNLGVEVCVWTVGVMLVSGGFGRDWWKRVLNAPVIAIIVAVVINLTGLYRFYPDFLTQVVAMLGRSAIPISLLLVGAVMYDAWGGSRLASGVRMIVVASILRLAIIPALFLLLAWIVPFSLELKRVIAVQASMPGAVLPVVLARLYGGDVPTAIRVAIGTSLAGILTLPAWLAVGLWLFG